MSMRFCCLAKNFAEVNPVVPTFLCCTPRLLSMSSSVMGAQVLLTDQPESMANALLNAGASRVYLGEQALFDSSVVTRLVDQFGAERVGLQVPVQRQSVSWSFETESNADFNVVTPSLCEPVWEVLRATGESSGVRAEKWLNAMLRHGISSVLVRADIRDDADLNLCAGMVESLGEKLWVAPLNDPAPPLADWVAFGQVRQLVLPTALYLKRHALLPAVAHVSPSVLAS